MGTQGTLGWMIVWLAIGAVVLMGGSSAYLARAAVPHPPPPHAAPAVHPPGPAPALPGPAVRPPLRRVPHLHPVVLHRAPATVVVRTVEDLPPIPPAPPAPSAPVLVREGKEAVTAAPKAFKVVRVGDDLTLGLLIDGKETPVRLLGVDLPEDMDTGGKGPNPKMIATRTLRNMVLNEFVTMAADPAVDAKDEDGVAVAYLYRAPDGLFINLEVIRQGLAAAATDYEFQYKTQFRFYGDKAQADDKGVWAHVKRAESAPKRAEK